MMTHFTREEWEIVKAFEAGTLQSPPDRSSILKAHREYAAATFRTDRQPPSERTPTPEPE